MIKKIKNLLTRLQLTKKINQLDIKTSGIDEEGDSFVVLNNKLTFYGGESSIWYDKYLYFLLSSKTKEKLKFEAIQVAMDIVIRYMEGSLMYGGPTKQKFYTVKTGDYVSEMGAYQGFYSIKLAQLVGPEGRVIAIEPMPDNFRLLQKNKKSNNLSQLITLNIGVWDEKSTLTFSRNKEDGQSASIEKEYKNVEKITVPVNSLDNIFQELGITPVDFMIIQLNGAEINALRGLTLFKPHNLSIAARYDTEGEDAATAIKTLLEKRHYQVNIVMKDFVFANLNK